MRAWSLPSRRQPAGATEMKERGRKVALCGAAMAIIVGSTLVFSWPELRLPLEKVTFFFEKPAPSGKLISLDNRR